jgi:hypothetical protein
MRARRLLALAAALSTACLVVTTPVPATARPVEDPCVQQRGPIPVHALASATRSGCTLVGRLVVDGRVAVVVPPPGMSVSGGGIGVSGDVRGLTVTNTGTTVRAVRGAHGTAGGGWYLVPLSSTSRTTSTTTSTTSTSGTMVSSRAGSRPACQDRTFHLEHHKWKSALRYRVNLSKMPRHYHKKIVSRQIKVANQNMRKGRNTCGRPRLATPASHYLGHTSKRPNIRAAGPTCGKPNSQNVVGFGNLPGGLLGWTCFWYYSSGRIAGADILLDTGANMTTHLPKRCADKWDFEGVVTHEWGHAYGLAHTGSGHAHLTMQHLLAPCSAYARTLGLGDWLGMNKMYGHRH